MGTDGEYAGERIVLPSLSGRAAKCVVIGRSSSCDVKMALDDQISRRHAQVRSRPPAPAPPTRASVRLSISPDPPSPALQIEWRDGVLSLRDLGSTYGTQLNGGKLAGTSSALKAGDIIGMGASSFELRALNEYA